MMRPGAVARKNPRRDGPARDCADVSSFGGGVNSLVEKARRLHSWAEARSLPLLHETDELQVVLT